MMQIQAVIFDLGGTLLHYYDSASEEKQKHFLRVTMIGVKAVYQKLIDQSADLPRFEEFTLLVDKHIGQSYQATAKELRGNSLENPVRKAFQEAGVALSNGQWEVLRPFLYQGIDTIVSPREGLIMTLEALVNAGYKTGLISNTFWASDLHDRHLKEWGIIDYLPERIYSCDHPRIKPHPDIFTDMLNRLNVQPSEAVYVGDTPAVDIDGAKAAKMHAILIRSPYVELTEPVNADAIIDELPNLMDALATLEGLHR